MNYRFGWEITPEIKALEEDRIKIMERLEQKRLSDMRKQDILIGIALFFWAISMSVPLIVRLIK
jgi:hypothetical protein